MSQNWNAPGVKPKIKYKIMQFQSGEWAIERTETSCIAWFPDRGKAEEVMRSLLPLDAERS